MGKITRNELDPALAQELQDVFNYVDGTDAQALGAHLDSRSNPHGVTKAQVGLGNVENVLQLSKAEFDTHMATTNPHGVTTAQIGAVPTSRSVSTGSGLLGGGTLGANLTLSIDHSYMEDYYYRRGTKVGDADTLDGYHHTSFHKVGSRFIDMGSGYQLFYGANNNLYFRDSGYLDRRVYHNGNITFGSANPSGGQNGDIYIQY